MKKCPFCAEEIQDDAIKCRYCGEWLDKKSSISDLGGHLINQEKLRGQDNSLPHEASEIESPPESSSQQSTVATPPTESPKGEDESLYEAILGEKNRSYYLKKFKEFDKRSLLLRDQKVGWNWSAFFFSCPWVVYRKMYRWFFYFLGIFVISGIVERVGFPVLGSFISMIPLILFAMYADWFYYVNVKKKIEITIAQRPLRDRSMLIKILRHKGGVHTWAIWVFGLLPVIIIAAFIIPEIVNYNKREVGSTWSKPESVIEMPTSTPSPDPSTETSDSRVYSIFDLDKIKRDVFYQQLEERVPQWETINNSPGFIEWLSGYDAGCDSSRKVMIMIAYDRFDAVEVAKYLKRFSSEYRPP